MAAREHQGYQIALVIFVMTTVLLSITTFMFFRKYKEEQDKNVQASDQLKTASADTEKAKAETASLKPLIGFTVEPLDVIAKAVDADRRVLGPFLTNLGGAAAAAPVDEGVVPEDGTAPVTEITNPLNYRAVVAQAKIENDKLAAANVKLAEEKEALNKTIAANRGEDKGKTDAASAGQATAQTELGTERTKFNGDRDDFKGKVDQAVALGTKKQEAMTALDTETAATINDLKNKLAAAVRDRTIAVEETIANRPRAIPEQTDGEITAIIARDRTVYLNLGSSDGLRPQVTFSVFSRDNEKLAASEAKAKVEVIQISGPKSSIARIIEDTRGNPILPGDRVFSPAFHPGRKVRFAIAGDMDIQGGRQRIRDLISINGGVIDAEVTDEGKRIGNVTAQTRYLILGEAPADPKLLDLRSALITDAKKFGVQEMNVQQFLDMMGYKADERTVGLGKGANPDDFKPKANSAYDKPFRERRPPAGVGTK